MPENTAGEVPQEFSAQAKLAWVNVLAQLHASGMSVHNLVKVTTFLSSREYAVENRQERALVLGSHAPALTVIITGIFDAKWLLKSNCGCLEACAVVAAALRPNTPSSGWDLDAFSMEPDKVSEVVKYDFSVLQARWRTL